MKPLHALVLLLEKALSTYVQAFLTGLIVGPTIGASTAQIAALAALPTALTVIANGLAGINPQLPFVYDVVFRTVRTYVASFIGFLLAMPTFHLDYSAATAAATSALPSALAVAKGFLASQFGNGDTAALLPATVDPPAPPPALPAAA